MKILTYPSEVCTSQAALAAAIAVLGGLAIAPATSRAQEVTSNPFAGAVKLERVSANGEGCPKGTWTAKLSADAQTVSMTFRSFATEITPSRTTSADDCRLAIVLRAPVGASYQVSRFVFRGYAYLEKGVEADLSTSHYFQLDESQSEQLKTTMLSPFDGEYAIEARTSKTELWAPCTTTEVSTLNVQFNIQLRNGNGGNPKADGTVEVHEGLDIDLAWKKC